MNDTILLAKPEEEFKEGVENVLKYSRGGHLLELAKSDLAQSSLVASCFLSGEAVTSIVRGRAMQSVLRWGVEQLRPHGEHSGIEINFRNYNILDGSYIKGMAVAEVAELMGISDQHFYRLRPQAIESLTRVLREVLASEPPPELKQYFIADRYASHTPDEQRILRIAATCRYPIPITLIHQMWPLPRSEERKWRDADIQASIHNLVMAGLLVSDELGINISVHPEMRQHLLTLLSPQERQEWHEAAGKYYQKQQQYVEAARHLRLATVPEQAAQLLIDHYQDVVDDLQLEELHNLLAKFRSAELPDHLWWRLKLVSGQVAEVMADLERALAEYGVALGATEIDIKAEAYYRRAKVLELQNLDEALAHFWRGIELLEQANRHDALLIKMYIDSAWIFIQEREDLEQAEKHLKRAEQLIPPQNRRDRVKLHETWATFLFHKREPENALQQRWQAWVIAQELQDTHLMIDTAHNLGVDYAVVGQYKKALSYLEKSKELAIKASNHRIEGSCNSQMGACYFWLAQYQEALHYYELAYEVFVKSGNRNWQAGACHNLAEVHAELGDRHLLQHYFHEGVKIAQELQHQPFLQAFDELARKYPDLFLPSLSLNERQLQAFDHVKQHGKITNRKHRELTGAAKKTAGRDLQHMVEKGILKKEGKGRSTHYVLAQNEESEK
ncbi:MAG: tetratricopeptide repeat protein [Ardenticatenaceae bacterium]